MKKQACSICGAEARVVKGDYQFKESGLRDVVLLDIDLIKCGECGNIDPILPGVDDIMSLLAVAVLQKPYRLEGAELRFLRKHVGLNQEEFSKLVRADKTTLSKWENDEDHIGIRSDLLARTVVISRDKYLEKRAADHIKAFLKAADRRKHLRLEVDTDKLEYEYA